MMVRLFYKNPYSEDQPSEYQIQGLDPQIHGKGKLGKGTHGTKRWEKFHIKEIVRTLHWHHPTCNGKPTVIHPLSYLWVWSAEWGLSKQKRFCICIAMERTHSWKHKVWVRILALSTASTYSQGTWLLEESSTLIISDSKDHYQKMMLFRVVWLESDNICESTQWTIK